MRLISSQSHKRVAEVLALNHRERFSTHLD